MFSRIVFLSSHKPASTFAPCSSHTFRTSRGLATAAVKPAQGRPPRDEGTIADVFKSLSNQSIASHLPERYAELKRHVLADVDHAALLESWREVLEEVGNSAEEIISRGGDVIPRVSYADIEKGLSEAQIHAIKNTGVVVVTGGVPKDEALGWKQSIKDYIASNPVKGFPPENIQAYELYNTKSQTYARTHPAVLRTQKALLGLWHSSSPVPIDFSTPISYFDRLRIRTPGDTSFTLGPHMDGGSIERWEDKTYRNVYRKILSGGSLWKEYDPFDARWRLRARQDLYNTPNQCSILRCWQGWTSLSTTGVNEGTLRVLPMLSAATAYLILRPFFRPRVSLSSLRTPYKVPFEDWEIDLESSAFPGTTVRGAQELNANTHPHLRLDKTMVSVPLIEPGDQVYWHCDLIHSVESVHQGTSDSSVLYIPAVPLTLKNALYLRDQRINFVHGYPAPDFPGGEGESKFLGRASAQDIHTREGRQALGFEPFVSSAGSSSVKLHEEANKILFG